MVDKRVRAAELRLEADRLEREGHAERPLPGYWRKGQKVRYIRSAEWGFSKGGIGVVVSVDRAGVPAAEYQVLHTRPVDCSGEFTPTWWTTPDDIELVEE